MKLLKKQKETLRRYILAESYEEELLDSTIDEAIELLKIFFSTKNGKLLFIEYVKDEIQEFRGEIDWGATLNDILVFNKEFQNKLVEYLKL